MNKEQQLKRIFKLHQLFQAGMIPVLQNHVVHPNLPKDSRENYLYFTLSPSLNFQRSSPALWTSALKTYEDPETRYVFFPEEVTKRTRAEVQTGLAKHKLALQKNKHTDIWISLSNTFHNHFQNDPRELLKAGNWDIVHIHKIIQQDMRKEFPYISGPKLANYWLYILSHYTDAKFKDLTAISIIPDTHVLQSSVKLGLTTPNMTPMKVAEVWKNLLKGQEISPAHMHAVLWNWSRNNFLPKV